VTVQSAHGPGPGKRETITARGLTKQYGRTVAVQDLSFTVRPGVVTGFLGPNGAGKSTTMRMLIGLDQPDAGQALVNGRPYQELRRPLREVGAMLEAKSFNPGRSARAHRRSRRPTPFPIAASTRSLAWSAWRPSAAAGPASSPSAWRSGSASRSPCWATPGS